MGRKINWSIWVFVLLVYATSSAQAFQFTQPEKERLLAGETVIRLLPSSGQKGFYGGSGFALIDAPVNQVWKTIQSWDDYPKMFPYTKVCYPVSRKGNITLLKMKIGHPIVNVHYHLQTTTDKKSRSLLFQLITAYPHDLDMLKGYWRLFPQKNNKTLVAYVVSVKAPAGVIVIVGHKLANEAIEMLLSIPGDVKRWLEPEE